jgi:hypothetical protein
MKFFKLAGIVTLLISIIYSPFFASLALTRPSYLGFFDLFKYGWDPNYSLLSITYLLLAVLLMGGVSLFFTRLRYEEFTKKLKAAFSLHVILFTLLALFAPFMFREGSIGFFFLQLLYFGILLVLYFVELILIFQSKKSKKVL